MLKDAVAQNGYLYIGGFLFTPLSDFQLLFRNDFIDLHTVHINTLTVVT